MIGTFWNLCRACPSMPVDKLHSEYRSTYRWHEYTGPRQEVVRKPPQPTPGNREEEECKNVETTVAPPPTSVPGAEPALPRRKKNPSLAYRSHDLIGPKERDSASLDRARCAERERERSGRRSKSEGPPHAPPSSPPAQPRVLRSDSDPSQFPAQELMCNLPSEGGGLKQAISRISTEYRFQFAWPRGKKSGEEEGSGPPRKSLSMGAIKPTQNQQTSQIGHQIQNQPAPVHKKRLTQADKTAGTAELEPLVSHHDDSAGEEKIVQDSYSKGEKMQINDFEFKTEYKKKFRPFSQYDYVEGRFKPKRELQPQIVPVIEKINEHGDSWFSEVIELRKKAGEYKHRGWGTELVPDHIAELYTKQISLWEQVSRRSSLSALSLASSTHRHITKEEKEKENNKKSSPTKAAWHDHIGKTNLKNEKLDKDFPRSRIDHFVRHHLERTTGVEDGGILHSPTREKLEPVVIRKKDAGESTRSPQKSQTYTGRSHSAGPNTAITENHSPKRTPRPPKQPPPEKRQRPTTLDTAPSRNKPKTGSNKGAPGKTKSGVRSRSIQKRSQSALKEKSADEMDTSEAEVLEPVVKSPPEPTRVKSPEQVLIRSPEPVNWTVPLDTGKTFTVTQNVTEGESPCRPHSESKVRSDTTDHPPPPPQSAPPAFTNENEQKKEEDTKSFEKPVPGTTLRCLEDPSFTFESSFHEQAPPTDKDVLEKAHSRFDQFWGKTNPESVDNQGHV